MATRRELHRKILEHLEKWDRKISGAFFDSIENIKSNVKLAEIERLLRAGRFSEVLDIASDVNFDRGMAGFSRTLSEAYLAGGTFTAAQSAPFVDTLGVKVEVFFDVANPELGRIVQANRLRFIREVSTEQRVMINQSLSRQIVEGVNPRDMAREIRDSIGLTSHQERAVANYRKHLQNLDSDALVRRLRDKRFDPTIARAIKEGKPLTKAQMDKMVDRYRKRFVKYRSEVIARTESTRALNLSNKQLWDNLVQEGKIEEGRIKRFWIFTQDSRTRDAHRSIPRLNKEGVGLNEPFRSPLGLIMYPGDPNATPGNVIQCRCTVFHKIVS